MAKPRRSRPVGEGGFRDESESGPTFDYESARRPPTENFRQQDKIASALETLDAKIFDDYWPPVSEEFREQVCEHLYEREGMGTPDRVRWVLHSIEPFSEPKTDQRVFREIEEAPGGRDKDFLRKQMKAFISAMNHPSYMKSKGASIEGVHSRYSIGVPDIDRFRTKYNNPFDFEGWARPFLRTIEQEAGSSKKREYEQSLRVLGKILYGKQWEYWEQLKIMTRKGKDRKKSQEHDTKRERRDTRDSTNSWQRQNWGGYETYWEWQEKETSERQEAPQLTRKYKIGINGSSELKGKGWRRNYAEETMPKVVQKETEIRADNGIPLSLVTEDTVYMYQIPSRSIDAEEASALLYTLLGQVKELCPEDTPGKIKLRLRQMISPDLANLPDIEREVKNTLTKELNAKPDDYDF